MDSDSPTMELVFGVDVPLTSLQIAAILEAGMTFLLYQRGQIPLPYQQLEKSALLQLKTDLDRDKENGRTGAVPFEPAPAEGCFEDVNPRARISLMIQERRKRLLTQKLEKLRRLTVAAEAKAYNAIRPALEALEYLIKADAHSMKDAFRPSAFGDPKGIVAVALILGPSVYCPKEVFFFDLPVQQMPDESTAFSKLPPEQFQNKVLRQFYKQMITNPDLLDFTDKPLQTTYTHICVISSGNLDSTLSDKNISNYRNIVRLPSIPPAILNPLLASFTSGSFISGTDSLASNNAVAPLVSSFSRRAKNKFFRIKIHHNNFFEQRSMDMEIESTTSDGNSFSSDTLFDSNSFSCYQIPLRFKGVPCKNKGL